MMRLFSILMFSAMHFGASFFAAFASGVNSSDDVSRIATKVLTFPLSAVPDDMIPDAMGLAPWVGLSVLWGIGLSFLWSALARRLGARAQIVGAALVIAFFVVGGRLAGLWG